MLVVPSFKFNLISVQCLTSQLKAIISFTNSSCIMQGPSLKSPLEIGSAKDGLYFTCSRCPNCRTLSGLSLLVSTPSFSVSHPVSHGRILFSCTSCVKSFHENNEDIAGIHNNLLLICVLLVLICHVCLMEMWIICGMQGRRCTFWKNEGYLHYTCFFCNKTAFDLHYFSNEKTSKTSFSYQKDYTVHKNFWIASHWFVGTISYTNIYK